MNIAIPKKYRSTQRQRHAQRKRVYAALHKHFRLQVGFWLGHGYSLKLAQKYARTDVRVTGIVASKLYCY